MEALVVAAALAAGAGTGVAITLATYLEPGRLQRKRRRKAVEQADREDLDRRLTHLRRQRTWDVELGDWEDASKASEEIALIEEVLRHRDA